MNPDTNRLEQLTEGKASPLDDLKKELAGLTEPTLLRPDGSPVPKHWSTFRVGETLAIKGYTFRVGYIGESTLLLEPVGPVLVGDDQP